MVNIISFSVVLFSTFFIVPVSPSLYVGPSPCPLPNHCINPGQALSSHFQTSLGVSAALPRKPHCVSGKPSYILSGRVCACAHVCVCLYVWSAVSISEPNFMWDGLVHLISCCGSTTLTHRNVIYFCILTLDPVTTRNLLNHGLSLNSLRYFAYKIMLSAHNKSFISSFPTKCL